MTAPLTEAEFWQMVGRHNAQQGASFSLDRKTVEGIIEGLADDRMRLLIALGKAADWGVLKERNKK